MSKCKIGEIEVPYVYAADVSRTEFAHIQYTAGGVRRKDIAALPKRIWEIKTRPLLKSEVEDITDYLDSIYWTTFDFWLEEFGEHTVKAQIDAEKFSETNTPIGRNGIWDIWARELSFRVHEV